MTTRKRQKLPEEVRRAAILQAARRLFNRKGYAQTRMDQVAEAAGLTKGGLYFHFKNKKALYEALILSMIQSLDQRMEQAGQNPADPVERLRIFFDSMLEEVAADFEPGVTEGYPGAVDLFMEGHKLMFARRQIGAFYRRLRAFVSDTISQGQKDGLFPGVDPQASGVAAISMMSGLYLQYATTPDAFELEKTAHALVAIFLRGVGAPGAQN